MLVNLEGLDVLVVDDSEQMRAYHRSVLEMNGVSRIREARDGAEAFRLICADPPRLLITDYDMAPEDGVALTRKVRTEGMSPNPYLPVVMVTAHTDKLRVGMARDAGVSGLLHKPVSPKELSLTIADAIADPRPFIRTRNYFGPDRRSSRSIMVRNERRALAAAVGP